MLPPTAPLSLPPLATMSSGITTKQVMEKIIEKIEQKYKGGVSKERLTRIFENKDANRDGFISLIQFKEALTEGGGNPISEKEAIFLFDFFDTLAHQKDPEDMVEIPVIVDQILQAQPQYGTGFNSGDELIKANKGGRGNLPSQAGGIFGGGSYEVDARNELPPMGPPAKAQPLTGHGGPAAPSSRPKGNQSSIAGGIFGDAAPAPPSTRSNRSNQSSIPGGIFGEQAAPAVQAPKHGRHSNASSIPGGIFG